MKTEVKSTDKVQKICEILKEETIEPAKQEAKEIVENAHLQKEEIIKHAKEEAAKIEKIANEQMDKRKKAFEASLSLAARQGIDRLKQQIEKKIFSDKLGEIVKSATCDPKVIAEFVNAIIEAIKEEGTDADLSAYIPKKVSKEKINEYLLSEIINHLREKEVLLGDFEGGAKVKMHDMQITIDVSDEAIKAVLAEYIRSGFRDLIFNA